MLSCNVKLAGKYSYLAPKFMAGLKWLSETDITALPDGKHSLPDSDLVADVQTYTSKPVSPPENAGCVLLNKGDFIIVIPEEAHMPKCAVKDPEKVRKVVIKVKA